VSHQKKVTQLLREKENRKELKRRYLSAETSSPSRKESWRLLWQKIKKIASRSNTQLQSRKLTS